MEKETKGIQVEVGCLYKRRDGLEAFVYYKSPVSGMYRAVLVGSIEDFSVYENGKESKYEDSVNDLVEVIQD